MYVCIVLELNRELFKAAYSQPVLCFYFFYRKAFVPLPFWGSTLRGPPASAVGCLPPTDI